MTVICEECGKIYHIDIDKLNKKLIGKKARIKCRVCGHMVTIQKPDESDYKSTSDNDVLTASDDATSEVVSSDSTFKAEPSPTTPAPVSAGSVQISGFGLRSKMFFLFLVIPIALMSTAGYFFILEMNSLVNELNSKNSDVSRNLLTNITSKSTKVVRKLAEQKIVDKARAVALQSSIFIQANPKLDKKSFNNNKKFKPIFFQKVGKTGYTVLFEYESKDHPWTMWTHPNPKLAGLPNTYAVLEKILGKNFKAFSDILNSAQSDGESKGYYSWIESDGQVREKFMVLTPIKGTSFGISATTYIDEFTADIKKLESEYLKEFEQKKEELQEFAKGESKKTRNMTFIILVLFLFIIGGIIIIYGYKLTHSIKYLTSATDRISVGELDVEIVVKSKDEIGALAEAISRMQDSLRISIQRLRRKR